MNQPTVSGETFPQLMTSIESGRVKIPNFQRDFVWTIDRSAKLIDSMLRGYPIGTFILWKTKERLRHLRNIGGADLPEPPVGDYTLYVLDGQQRLTSLFASTTGTTVSRESGKTDDFASIWINLNETDGDIVTHEPPGEPGIDCIRVSDLMNAGIQTLAAYPAHLHAKLENYQNRLKTYTFSLVTLNEAPLDIATEVFTRINIGGVKLTVFEIMVAKTYRAASNGDTEFDLGRAYEKLNEKLEAVEFETVPPIVLLYLVSAIVKGDCTKKSILNIDREAFIEAWGKAVDGIERAVDYIRSAYRVPASRLLPYYALLVPFGYFFTSKKGKPTAGQAKLLRDFFFRASLTGRYTGPTETNLGQDLDFIDAILAGETPAYTSEFALKPDADLIEMHGHFRTSRAFIKAILCILCAKQPRAFDDGNAVTINNDWLKRANSKNYHHFFPKAYLKRQGYTRDWEINHIANITIVDDYLNKVKIKDKAPSKYMKTFAKENADLVKTMRSHLIVNLDKFGVMSDDYETFFRKRCIAIAREVDKQLVTHLIDDRPCHVRRAESDEDTLDASLGD